jgi:hypothetical protein
VPVGEHHAEDRDVERVPMGVGVGVREIHEGIGRLRRA